MLNAANFPKPKEYSGTLLVGLLAHIILLSTLKKHFPRKMFYGTINLYGYKKPYIDHGSKIVQTVENGFV